MFDSREHQGDLGIYNISKIYVTVRFAKHVTIHWQNQEFKKKKYIWETLDKSTHQRKKRLEFCIFFSYIYYEEKLTWPHLIKTQWVTTEQRNQPKHQSFPLTTTSVLVLSNSFKYPNDVNLCTVLHFQLKKHLVQICKGKMQLILQTTH